MLIAVKAKLFFHKQVLTWQLSFSWRIDKYFIEIEILGCIETSFWSKFSQFSMFRFQIGNVFIQLANSQIIFFSFFFRLKNSVEKGSRKKNFRNSSYQKSYFWRWFFFSITINVRTWNPPTVMLTKETDINLRSE